MHALEFGHGRLEYQYAFSPPQSVAVMDLAPSRGGTGFDAIVHERTPYSRGTHVIDKMSEVFLRACAARGVDFSRTLMLGRQQLTDASFAEPFFQALGAGSVESLDASSFEGAGIIADLNRPLRQDLRRRFSVVFDGGTLEHVFDVATAFRSCLDLVELDGHFLAISPANNWPGHGFYQFSPELLFRVLSIEVGFQIRGAFVAELRTAQRWYEIIDPRDLGARLYWRNRFRTYVMVVAKRVKVVDLSEFTPQQSDYTARWDSFAATRADRAAYNATRIKGLLKRVSPSGLQALVKAAKQRQNEKLTRPKFIRVSVGRLSEHIR
jgi:hypothetical protein